jgi:hypothetical protein
MLRKKTKVHKKVKVREVAKVEKVEKEALSEIVPKSVECVSNAMKCATKMCQEPAYGTLDLCYQCAKGQRLI